MKTIKDLNIKGLTLNFNMNGEYFANFEVEGEYRNYKIYSNSKGNYINFKNKRYYLDFIF